MTTTTTTTRLLTPRFVLVVIVGLLYFLSLGMLLPIVPPFVKDQLHGGDLAVGIAVGAFSVGAVLLRPFAGRLGDHFGRRVLIIGGAAVVGVSVALYHVVPTMPVLVAVRVLGGIGEAAFFVGAGTMVTDLAPVERRGEAISYWSVAVYGGISFGPFLGEFLHERWSFGIAWTVASCLAFGAALLGLLTTETLPPEKRRTASDRGERFRLLYRPSLAPGVVLFLGMVGLAGFFEFVPLYAKEIGMSESRGVYLAYGFVVLVVRVAGARLPDVLGPLRAGSGATLIAAIGLTIAAAVGTPVGLYAGAVVFAAGMSLLYPAMLTLALTDVPESERAASVGTVSSFFDLSQGLGAVLLGGIAVFGGYRGAFLGGALFAVLGLVLLRSGIDPRTHESIDHEAAEAARAALEPEP